MSTTELHEPAAAQTPDGRITGGWLVVEDLVVVVDGPDGREIRLVDGVSFTVDRGEVLAVVGESGSGKSMTMLAVMGLLPPGVRVASGRILLDGVDLRALSADELRRRRGLDLAMIFQDPMTSLNPVHRVGSQLGEAVRVHRPDLSREQVRERVVELMELVGLPEPRTRLRAYPHEFSGGQRQRLMIAMAMAHEPGVLIADEPTTALDVTIQAQLMEVLRDVRARTGSAMVLVTHDLGLVAENADRVVVMHDATAVETASVPDLFAAPRHAYTRSLLGSLLTVDSDTDAELSSPISARVAEVREQVAVVAPAPVDVDTGEEMLSVIDLHKHFPLRGGAWGRQRGVLKAVDGVSLLLRRGETLGLVGESGCGKSTLVRTILGMYEPTSGAVCYRSREISGLSERARRPYRAKVQVVFQDPYSSLDPRMSVHDLIAEPLRINARYDAKRVEQVMDHVGLTKAMARRKPAEFSGGQRQRIGIARALALDPEVLILDEPVSALDVSIQAQVINLLRRLQTELGLTYLFIAHDLAVVRYVSQRVAVMRKGVIVEQGSREQVFGDPQHDYTRTLLDAVPVPDPQRRPDRSHLLRPA